MPIAHLDNRALVAVDGPDAEHLLQNVVTTDLSALGEGEAKAGALLSPQGKILFDFLISRAPGGALLLECRADIADELVRRLTLYRLRASASISRLDPGLVRISWGDDSSAEPDADMPSPLRDTRFLAADVRRAYVGTANVEASDLEAWTAFRIAQGVPESGLDYQLGDAFPHDVLLDQLGGVGFRKGCYIGQEVVSRMQHRGTARRRALILSGGSDLPASGTGITAGGRALGTLGSVAGRQGLAILRIDRIKEAQDAGMPLLAGEAPVAAAIPGWATFTFPTALAEA